MRLIPVKTRPISRRVRVRFVIWGISLRMKVLDGDPDVWLLESRTPTDGSPWALTRAYGGKLGPVGSGIVSQVVEAEARLRLDTVHDYWLFGFERALGPRWRGWGPPESGVTSTNSMEAPGGGEPYAYL